MRVLVTGARGVLGSRVMGLLNAANIEAISGSRSQPSSGRGEAAVIDLATGRGLEEAVIGVTAIIHCAGDRRRHREVDAAGTLRLIEAARNGGVQHILYPGVVGTDVIPLAYYRSKAIAEALIEASGLRWTIMRTTHFHHLIWRTFEGLARLPVLLVPRDTRLQPLDPGVVARRLVDQVLSGPGGRLQDLGGPHAYEAADLAGSFLAATRRRRPVAQVAIPGLAAAAFRAGGNLTPHRAESGATWNAFVETMIDQRRRLMNSE